MSHSLQTHGYLILDPVGMPVTESLQQGRRVLVFLKQGDAGRYCRQMREVHQASRHDYAIAALTLHHIRQILNLERVQHQLIEQWQTY